MPRFSFPDLRLAALAAIAAGGMAHAAQAQNSVLVPVNSNSREVVQPLPPEGTDELNAALKRLAIDSRDVDALLAAGNASLKLHDVDAAIGFFTRAQTLGSDDGAAKAGLAAAEVYKKKPVEALKLFAEAQAEGASLAGHASDYGLAYDLVGDNARAQQLYREALAHGANDETTRRLALSQAIGGDQMASEKTLLPLLQHRDLAAYRTRAFALAALGKTDEAVSIADAIMPASLAGRIAPYLRYMPKLTRAQQAAAASFGHFPEADAIGHDDPRIAEYERAAHPGATAQAASDARLVPAGAPLGPEQKPAPPPSGPIVGIAEAKTPPAGAAKRVIAAGEANRPPPQSGGATAPHADTVASLSSKSEELPPLARQPAEAPPPDSVKELPPLAAEKTPAAMPPPEAPAPARTGRVLHPPVPASTSANSKAASPGFDLGGVSGSKQAPPAAPAAEPEQQSVDDAFADFEHVKAKREPPPGAVDITSIEPPRAKPEPPKPKNPSRIWVQVATGKNRKALRFDWEHRITRKAASAFKGKDGYLVDWGRTNRLVTGPFSSDREAQAFVDELRRAGIKTFIFTSKRGERVTPLP